MSMCYITNSLQTCVVECECVTVDDYIANCRPLDRQNHVYVYGNMTKGVL